MPAFTRKFFLMNAADDEGGDLTGAALAAARGDFIEPPAGDDDDDIQLPPAGGTADAGGAAGGDGKPAAGDDTPPADDDTPPADDAETPSADDKGEKGKGGKEPLIPKSRFDEAVRKEREKAQRLQDQLAEINAKQAEAAKSTQVKDIEASIAELEKQYQGYLDDGKTDKAVEAMRQIRMHERDLGELRAAQATAQATETVRLGMMIDKIEETYPELNPNSETFDADLVAEVEFLRGSFAGRGLSATAALSKAVEYAMKGRTKPAEDNPPVEDKKGLSAKPDEKPDAKGSDKRKQDAVKKAVDAANKQPPKMDSLGEDSDTRGGGVDGASLADMTEDEFAALPDSVKRRLRGDMIN